MGNIYQSALPGSTNTLRVTDAGVALHGGINAIDLKKEDLHAIAAEILAIGLDPNVESTWLSSASHYAASYSEDELMRLAHRMLQAAGKRRDLDETKRKEEQKHEALREEVAKEFYGVEVLNLSSKAIKAVDEIVSLRQLIVETALENQ